MVEYPCGGDDMKLIVGLGNPGKQYERTRHNAGYMVMDELEKLCSTSIKDNKFNALVSLVNVKGEKVLLMKPLTYMNLSGNAVQQAVHFYKIEPQDILIIHDDLDLPVGKIRIRTQGSAGGQKGMNDIIQKLGTSQLNRIRVGIDKDPLIPVVDYVLGKIPEDQMPEFRNAVEQSAQAAYAFINSPIMDVMNKFNKR